MKWDTEKEEKGWGGGVKNNVLKYQAYDININDMIFLKIFTGRNIFISFNRTRNIYFLCTRI